MIARALHQGALTRADAWKALKGDSAAALGADLPADQPLADGAGLAHAIAAAGITDVTVHDGMLLNASDAIGTIAGLAQGMPARSCSHGAREAEVSPSLSNADGLSTQAPCSSA